MKTAVKLALASLRHHPTRVALTSCATAAAVCVVLWVSSSYDALARSVDHFSSMALGRYPLSVAPISEAPELALTAEVVSALAADPAVARADPMWLEQVELAGDSREVRPPRGGGRGGLAFAGRGDPGRGARGARQRALLGLDLREPPFPLVGGRWVEPESLGEVVLSQRLAAQLGLEVGGRVALAAGRSLRVAGVMDVPAIVDSGRTLTPARILAPAAGELFVSRLTAETILGRPAEVSFAALSLAPGADVNALRFGWAPRLSKAAVPAQFQEAHELEEALDESATVENMQLQAYAATGVSLLVALLVVLSTLNMGVTERTRQLAVIRTIALTRGEVGVMIALEGLALATLGYLSGVAISLALLAFSARSWSALLHHGLPLGGRALGLAALACFGGALLASLIPAWRAMRVRPLDALAGAGAREGQRVPAWLAPLGLGLVALNPLMTFVIPHPFGSVMASSAIGFAAMSAGFVVLAPPAVALVDRWGAPLLARLLQVEPRLLVSQLTSNLWRTVAASVCLSVGLGLFVSIQVWGYTMLDAFVPGAWAPDAMVAFAPEGIDPEQAAALRQIPGVDPRRCYPLVVEQPRLQEDLTQSATRASVINQDNLVIVGLAPEAIAGPRPLLAMEWVAGTPSEALPALRDGRGCVVPDHFLREAKLSLGDEFALVPPERPEVSVRYTIVGAVKLPGWHWQTKHVGFRVRSRRAAALVFADYDAVASDFGLEAASHVWFDYAGPGADPEVIASGAQALYQDLLQREVTIGREEEAAEDQPFVRVLTVVKIREVLLGAARRWLWLISQVPLVAVLIACVGVLNVILASVRARRWELGVLRALGFTRGTLVRVVIAEGLAIGLVACALSLGFGVMAGWCGAGAAQYVSFFGGMRPDLVLPVGPLAIGLGLGFGLAGLAAVWPATRAGGQEPLSLLQQGRSSF